MQLYFILQVDQFEFILPYWSIDWFGGLRIGIIKKDREFPLYKNRRIRTSRQKRKLKGWSNTYTNVSTVLSKIFEKAYLIHSCFKVTWEARRYTD